MTVRSATLWSHFFGFIALTSMIYGVVWDALWPVLPLVPSLLLTDVFWEKRVRLLEKQALEIE